MPAGVCVLGPSRLGPGLVQRQRHERLQARLDVGDPSGERVDHLHRREGSVAEAGEQIQRRSAGEIGDSPHRARP
jgi:hypothetical protein